MKPRHMTGCRAWRKRLLAHLDGELPALEQLIFENHREECAACEQAVGFHLSIEQALHESAGPEPDATFEDRMVAGVFERLQAGMPVKPGPRPDLSDRTGRSGAVPTTRLLSKSGSFRLFAALVAAALVLVTLVQFALVPFLARTTAPLEQTAHGGGPKVPEGLPTVGLHSRPSDRRLTLEPDRVILTRLSAARETVHEALRSAGNAKDFRSEFNRQTATLSRERWPLEELVIGAIDHADPELANSAIRGVAELSFAAALPAVERATFRSRTAQEALVTLGTLAAERYLPRLKRNLAQPERTEAAATGLARSGSAVAARVLAQAATHADQQQVALKALLSMGAPGIGQLMRLREEGFVPAADLLRSSNLPTPSQIREVLERSDDPEVLRAVLPGAVDCGPDVLTALGRLIADDRLRRPALDAIIGIGEEPALMLLLGNSSLRGAAKLEVDLALRRILRASPAGTILAGQIARRPEGRILLEALVRAGEELQPYPLAIFEDRLALPENRATAAEWLASRGAVDPARLLAAVLEVALLSEAAAAQLLCSAARAGAGEADASKLAPISKRLSRHLLKRAEVIAARWAADGHPPHPWELRQLSKMITDTLPEL